MWKWSDVNWMWGKTPTGHPGNTGGQELPVRKSTKPLVGYRSWLISARPALRSIHIDYEWKTANTAECRALYNRTTAGSPAHDDPSPGLSCSCGLYVQKPDQPLEEWDKLIRGRVRASGTVALTGRVVVCEFGYKAQHAEIQSPVVVEADCRRSTASAPCFNSVEVVQPADEENKYPFAWCADHWPESVGLVEAIPWITRLCNLLALEYEGVEFLSELADW